jgi:hypothetical protein
MYTRSKSLFMGVLVLFVLGIIFYAINLYQTKNSSVNLPQTTSSFSPSPEPTDVVSQETTLEGTYVCLPHTDPNIQTEECALGIKLNDGTYYALSMGDLLGGSTSIKFSTGTRIRVGGQVVPIEMISSDQWSKYPVEGIMQVREIEQL